MLPGGKISQGLGWNIEKGALEEEPLVLLSQVHMDFTGDSE